MVNNGFQARIHGTTELLHQCDRLHFTRRTRQQNHRLAPLQWWLQGGGTICPLRLRTTDWCQRIPAYKAYPRQPLLYPP